MPRGPYGDPYGNPTDPWNQSSWNRGRPSPQTRGKTSYWDYDEYYRQHYNDSRQQQFNEAQWERMKESMKDPRFHHAPSNPFVIRPGQGAWIIFYVFLASCMLNVFFSEPADPRDFTVEHLRMHAPRHRPTEQEMVELRERVRRRAQGRVSTIYSADQVALPPMDGAVSPPSPRAK